MQTVYPINPTIDFQDKEENVMRSYKNIKCIKEYKEFPQDHVCYDYALDKFINNIEKKGYYRRLINCTDGYYILEDYFKKIPIKDAKKGDIITYHEINDYKSEYEKPCAGNCMHFAIISKTDGTLENTIVRSKWGGWGVYKGRINDTLDIYGTAIVIWRRL